MIRFIIRLRGRLERYRRLDQQHDICEQIWQCATQSCLSRFDEALICKMERKINNLERRMHSLLEELDAIVQALVSMGWYQKMEGEDKSVLEKCQRLVENNRQGLPLRWMLDAGENHGV